MERLMKVMVFLFFVGSLPLAAGADPLDNSPQRHDAEKALAQLRDEVSQLAVLKKQLASVQEDLVVARGKGADAGEIKTLEARVQGDQTDINLITTDAYRNLSSLLANWSHLTKEEKDFVGTAELVL